MGVAFFGDVAGVASASAASPKYSLDVAGGMNGFPLSATASARLVSCGVPAILGVVAGEGRREPGRGRWVSTAGMGTE